jgi:hypothetical protein
MKSRMKAKSAILSSAIGLFGMASNVNAQGLPEAIQASGEKAIMTVYAEGAQVYECKANSAGKLSWTFREPVATLLQEGKTVGRHYAGPHWELLDGSVIQGKVFGRAPGATPNDIPILKLEVSTHRGKGFLNDVTTIQRINTKGGVLEGDCDKAGAYRSIAYSTDYVFLKK